MYEDKDFIKSNVILPANKGIILTLQGFNGVGKNSEIKSCLDGDLTYAGIPWIWFDVSGYIADPLPVELPSVRSVVVINIDPILIADHSAAASLQEYILRMKENQPQLTFIFISSAENFCDDSKITSRFKLLYNTNVVFMPVWSKSAVVKMVKECVKEGDPDLATMDFDRLYELAGGDPVVVKRVFYMILADLSVIPKLNTGNVDEIYNLIGLDYLNERYTQITDDLSRNSLNYLLKKYKNVTPYLEKSGLVQDNKVFAQLFDHYVKINKSNLDLDNLSGEKISDLSQILTGQELLIFRLLEKAKGKLVSKEEIAELAWGPSWVDSYSEYALDKLISRIRKKLLSVNYPKTLKVVRGRGVILL